MRLRAAAAFFAAQSLCATLVLGGDITSGTLQIQGVSLEVDTPAVTTGIDIPTTIQTKFGGKTNEAAPLVEGLVAVGDLTGPGLDNPLRLTTAPGYRFQIPGFSREGVYYLQNVRLMKGNDFVAPAVPSAAAITVANVLQTSVKVRQLTPDELRGRGIVVDGRNYNVYEYSFTFLVDGKTVEIPFPVIVDPRTHEVTPIAKETPFNLPPTNGTSPPRWSPPDVVTFELPPDEDAAAEQKPDATPGEHQVATKRPSIPAAIVIPNSLAVLHQFFAVILTVSNGAPSGSTATLDDIRATIKVPAALRTAKTNPTVAFGQPVPIVDPTNNVTFLVAQAKGEAEWDLEGLQPGTHTVEIEVRATFRERGQQDVPLKATPRASIVVQDPRFNITFSHPDTVRKGIDYEGERLSQYVDRQGRVQNFRYNDRGQLTKIDRNGSPDLDQLEYDDAGRLKRWTNKDSALTWENYNLDGRPGKTTLTIYKNGSGFGIKEVAAVFEQTHTWDQHGERTDWTMPRPPGFTTTQPWTDAVRETRDAMGNVTGVQRTLFGSSPYASLITGDFRNAGRPNSRTVTTPAASIVRKYGYDPTSGFLNQMQVSAGNVVVAGANITSFDGLQIGQSQILGVSGGAHSQQWTYDTRSRLHIATNGRLTAQTLSPSDFRSSVERTPRLDAATRANLVAKGVNVDRIDPPSQTAGEGAAHRIGNVIDGSSVRTFTYNGSERQDDEKFAYEFDEKGRLTRATQKIGSTAPLAIMRVTYTYDGNDRMITRRVEMAKTSAPNTWNLATPDVLVDGIPAEAFFAWDPISDRLLSVWNSSGQMVRQVLHGGLGYDDPLEVTLADGSRLYPIFDEAGAGHLQAVLNVNGEVVSRKVVADAYGDDTFSIAGAAVDLVQITAKKDDAGSPTYKVSLRSTEELLSSTVTSGVRLAAVDGSGNTVRVASVTPTLVDPNTAQFTLTASEWNTLTAGAAGVSIAATKSLRASAWDANLPLLPAPEWATVAHPVFTSADLPVEVRESLANLSQWLASIPSSSSKTTKLYEVTDLALLGSDSQSDDPARFLVASPFHALPFFDSVTRLTQVRARWLDHSTGTFLTPDPLGYGDSANLYSFAAGDPVNDRDPTGLATPCPRGEVCMRAAEPDIPIMRAADRTPTPSALPRGGVQCSFTGPLKEVANMMAAPGFLVQEGPMADPGGYFYEAKCQEEETMMQATRLATALLPFAVKGGKALSRRLAKAEVVRSEKLSSNSRERGYQVQKTLAKEKYEGYEEAPRGRSAVDFREPNGLENAEAKSLDVTRRSYTDIVNTEKNQLLTRLKQYRDQLARYNRANPAPFNVLDIQLINADKLAFEQDMVLRNFVADALKKGIIVEISDFATKKMLIEPPTPNP